MSVDLRKCKVGDKVMLRNGKIATIVQRDDPILDELPISHDSGRGREGYHACTIEGKSCIDDHAQDIVSIVTPKTVKKPVKKNVAKIMVTNWSNGINQARVVINPWYLDLPDYMSRRNAIRGARRFCARIGFECEIVEDAK